MFSDRPIRFALFYLIATGWCCCTAQIEGDSVENATKSLWTAVGRNNPTAAWNAIRCGANIESRNPSGLTPLHLAAAEGHIEVTGVLLRANASIEAADSNGDRPLHLAVANGRDGVVALLFLAGAHLRAGGQGGLTPLQRGPGDKSTISLLLALSDVQAKSSGCIPKLLPIVHVPPVQRNRAQIENATAALWSALRVNDSVAVRTAVENGADVMRRYGEYTPLHVGADRGNSEVIDVLLKAGADIEAVDSLGNRPLHTAALFGRDGAVRRLVQAGANLNVTGQYGRTPLQTATYWKYKSTAELLRSLGAQQ